ncbi:MAG: hypothetical protein OHK0013_27410 [Sandaracinaceae bacterium]
MSKRTPARSPVPASFVFLAAVVGCGGDARSTDARVGLDTGPPSMARVRASWQVRCDALGDCAANPVRTLDATNGVDGARVECDVTMVGEERRFELRLEQGTDFGIAVTGATTGPTGGRLGGSSCSVDVLESAEMLSLRGQCSANPPTPEIPCQIQRIMVDPTTRTVSAELRCVGLGTIDGTGLVREVTGPASSSAFVVLELSGCDV